MRLVLGIMIVVACATSAFAEKRVALVFGADRYEIIRPLANAVRDARLMETALQNLGFQVTTETNRDLKRMRRALADFAEDADGADVALVYFAGHGVEIAGENRLLPTDADSSSLEALKETSLPLEEVRSIVAEASKIPLIVLDACRDDPFATQSDPNGRGVKALQLPQSIKPGLGRMGKAANMLFAFSAQPGETAADGDGENSPFTKSLARHINQKGREFRTVLIMVRWEVHAFTRSRQTPHLEDSLPDFFFAAGQAVPFTDYQKRLLSIDKINPKLRSAIAQFAIDTGIDLLPMFEEAVRNNVAQLDEEKRTDILQELATNIAALDKQLLSLQSASNPRVAELRREAQEQLFLGSIDEAERKLAEAVRVTATRLKQSANTLVTDHLEQAANYKLSGVAAEAKLDYQTAIRFYAKSANHIEDAQEIANMHGRALTEEQLHFYNDVLSSLGETQSTVGYYEAAEASYLKAHSAVLNALEGRSDDSELLRQLALFKLKIGDVRYFSKEENKYWNAQKIYLESYKIRKRLHQSAPQHLRYRWDLAIILERLGSVKFKLKQFNEAETLHGESLALIEKVSNDKPEDLQYRRDVAVAYNKMGVIFESQKKYELSVQAHNSALEINTQIYGKYDSKNRVFDVDQKSKNGLLKAGSEVDFAEKLVRGIGYSNYYIADIYTKNGNRSKAYYFYNKSLGYREILNEMNPHHDTWRWELYSSYMRASDHACQPNVRRLLLAEVQSFLENIDYDVSREIDRVNDMRNRVTEAVCFNRPH